MTVETRMSLADAGRKDRRCRLHVAWQSVQDNEVWMALLSWHWYRAAAAGEI